MPTKLADEGNWNREYFGGYRKEVTPVPISNTEVKLFCADGTAWVTVWESRCRRI